MAKLDPRLAQWPGGRLRVFHCDEKFSKTGRVLTLKFDQETEAKPVGSGFALLQPCTYQALPGVWVDLDVRDGQLQAVAVRSSDDGPELTQSVLRSIGSPRRAIREHGRYALVRLALDEHGEIYGVYSTSPTSPDDFLSAEERMADAQEAVEQATHKPGRPRIPSRELEELARVVSEAQSRRDSTERAVAQHFHISQGAAKKRIRIARERGFLRKKGE